MQSSLMTLFACLLASVPGALAGSFLCASGDEARKHQSYAVPIGAKFMPVLASRPRSARDKAIVVIHGRYNSDQGLYFDSLMGTVQAHGLQESVVVVAPGFPDIPCNEATWNGGSASLDALQWSRNTHQWIFGVASDDADVSSFQALDEVVTWVEQTYKVKEIVVAGFSAGGQMVQRWAVMSPHGEHGSTESGVPLRIVVGSPSTFAYLDAQRPDQTCSADMKTGSAHTCAHFSRPQSGSRRRGRHVANSCKGKWNDYGYGLDGIQDTPADASVELVSLNAYLKHTIHGEQQYAGLIRKRFGSKDFRLAVGTKDQTSCNQGECSSTCAAMTQGSNRLQRALNFKDHVESANPGYKAVFGTFEAGHDFNAFFNSPVFFDWSLKGRSSSGGRLLTEAFTSMESTAGFLV